MKMRAATNSPIRLLAGVASVMSLLTPACGNEAQDPHFSGKKYGKSSADAVTSHTGGDQTIDPATINPPVTTPADTTTTSVTTVDDAAANEDAPTLAPDALIKKNEMRAYFDLDAVRGIADDDGYTDLGLAESKVKESLTTAAGDGLILTQTFGDGVARSQAAQLITSSAGDANRLEGTPSASGLQTLFRVNSDACPGVFLCVEKQVSEPKVGPAFTVCFSKPFPYGALPNYKEADFTPYYKDYGPYTATSYAGANVDCSKPVSAPLKQETLSVTVSKADLAKFPLKLHTVKPLAAQLALSFNRHRAADDLVAPYIDETVALNHITTYVINTDAAEILALIVTKRQTIDIAAQVGGGIFGGIAGAIVGLDGIEVDLHFELCKNLLKPETPSFCVDGR